MGIHKSGVTMKYCRLLLFSLYLSLPSVFSLSCMRPCPAGILKPKNHGCTVCKTLVTADCSTKEIVRHPCGCPVCAKAEGEQCGRLCGVVGWDTVGICASFLTCELENSKISRISLRVCVKKEVKEVKKSFWKKMIDNIKMLFTAIPLWI